MNQNGKMNAGRIRQGAIAPVRTTATKFKKLVPPTPKPKGK